MCNRLRNKAGSAGRQYLGGAAREEILSRPIVKVAFCLLQMRQASVIVDLWAARPAGVNHTSAALRGAKRLQFADRFADIIERDIVGEVSSTNSGRHNKPNVSAFEFLVEVQCGDDFFAWEIFRQLRRQIESPQKIDNRVPLIR